MQRTSVNTADILKIRNDFPILERETRPGVKLVYLDSTATSQKPQSVIQVMDEYYRRSNANIHRGVHTLAEEATALYENAREKIAAFIGADSPSEVVYTRNATESLNLVAYSWARKNLQAGDLVILTEMEHHSNLVPWQMLAADRGVRLEFVTITPDYLFDMDSYRALLEQEPKLVSFTHMSNVLGTITPAQEIIRLAHAAGAVTVIDGAQSVPHFSVNVRDLDVDLMAFSAHKMLGPTGIGALYGKKKILDSMPPFMGGGDMIRKVSMRSFTLNDVPYKFEAGTPAVAEAVGFGAAVDYLNLTGMGWIEAHEREITTYAMQCLQDIPGLTIYGPRPEFKGGVVSFVMQGVHPHDVAQILDHDGIAVRAGHHCAMPLHQKYNLPATTRASFYLYNTLEEVDKLAASLRKVNQLFN